MNMKKIIVVPDVHGRTDWKVVIPMLNKGEVDEVVFIGDYLDSFDISGADQLENLKDILYFYNENKNKVTLLTGNHDLSYLNFDLVCSGFQNKMAWTFKNILDPLREDGTLKACYIKGDYLFSHAGITKTWIAKYGIDLNNLEQEVNDLFKKNIYAFGFQEDKSTRYPNNYGDDIFQSPMWVRPTSLSLDKLENYTYVVGHTYVPEPTLEDNIWFTDCHQDAPDKFLILDI